MTNIFIDCKEIATEIKSELKQFVNNNKMSGTILAIIQVGDNPASNSYIKGKLKDCEEVGIQGQLFKFEEDCTTGEILKTIEMLNNLEACRGIIVQLPLPAHLDKYLLLNSIADEKDVDGFKPTSNFTPCTPKGILTILNKLDVNLSGKVVCVVGKGETVGKPLVPLLMEKGATVISCNSKTKDLSLWASNCDILISCVGKKDIINLDLFECYSDSYHGDGYDMPSIIVDVGINRDENGKLCGDCEKSLATVNSNLKYITSVPGGVGLLTRVSLLENTIHGA